MADIFISYRRENGHLMAQLLYYRLIADGYKVFMDVTDLGPGTFDERLYQEIEQCTDFILILPPNALDRCQDPNDWIRMEIEHAIRYSKNIIPILMQGFEFPKNIPASIQRVEKYNGLEAPPPRYYDALYNKLKTEFLISKPQEEEEITIPEESVPTFTPIDEATQENVIVPPKPELPENLSQEKVTGAPKETKGPRKEFSPPPHKKPASKTSSKPIFSVLAATVVFVALIYAIVWFAGAPQREIDKESTELMIQAQEMLNQGEFQSAIQILNRISTDWRKYDEVDTAREQAQRGILLNQIRQYETAGKFEQLIKFVQENIQDPQADPDIRTVYANASAEYEALKLSEAEALIQQGDYITARSTLEAAATLIGEQPNLTDKRNEAEDKEVAAKIQAYEEAENYAEAIKYLNSKSAVISRNSELRAKLGTYKEIFRANVLDEAAKSYETEGYSAAISALNAGLKVLPNDSVISEKKTQYEEAAPVPLIEVDCIKRGTLLQIGNDKDYICDVFSYDTYYEYKKWDNIFKDVNGTNYSQEETFFTFGFFTYYESLKEKNKISATYYVNQQYDTLTGIIYRPYATLSCSFDWTSKGTVDIYGDGMLLKTVEVDQETFDPIPINVNISGIRELTIVLNGIWKDETYIVDYFNPKLCVTNLEVSKKP